VNRLQDLNYRVQAVNDLAGPSARVRKAKAHAAVVDLESKHDDVLPRHCRVESGCRHPTHIPIIAFAGEQAAELQARRAKSRCDAGGRETTIANYLPQLLNQALQV